MAKRKPNIILALDFTNQQEVFNLVDKISPEMCRLKVGKELFTLYGPEIVEKLQKKGFDIFLDLKFHDIPNTTAQAIKAAANLGVWMVNVHCSGGLRMLQACVDIIKTSTIKPLLIGVTVLTSLQQQDLNLIGFNLSTEELVLNLASLAKQAGLDGLVCSAHEANLLKQHYPSLTLVTPGIRLESATQDDQQRIMTPKQAIFAGADYLVIGRPITRAVDPIKALEQIIVSC